MPSPHYCRRRHCFRRLPKTPLQQRLPGFQPLFLSPPNLPLTPPSIPRCSLPRMNRCRSVAEPEAQQIARTPFPFVGRNRVQGGRVKSSPAHSSDNIMPFYISSSFMLFFSPCDGQHRMLLQNNTYITLPVRTEVDTHM